MSHDINVPIDNNACILLEKLESIYYKYTQINYNRETSLSTIKILLGFLSESEIQIILNKLSVFAKTHKSKFRTIFETNKHRYFEIPFLMQPEIFLVWFCLENFPFSITDNWGNEFHCDELEQIQTLWGKVIY